ncbi:MAG: hypothetical protein U5S82_05320 [Gammaproteobacteria bacterium]|nr:hypothetical protein [Gammaproteobacteria bacterium]
MSNAEASRPAGMHRPQRAAECFAEHSAAEKHRLKSFGDVFDEALFDEAVDLVLRKLKRLEDEGRA